MPEGVRRPSCDRSSAGSTRSPATSTYGVLGDAVEDHCQVAVAAANVERFRFRKALLVGDLGLERLELALGNFCSRTLVVRDVQTCQQSR